MAGERAIYLGPRLRRLRRDLGLTQSDMAADLEISPSYVALLERNQRPLTADLLLRLSRTYKVDVQVLAGDGGAEYIARLQGVLREPMFADIDLPPLQTSDVATNFPGLAEAFLRLHTAYREEQMVLADRSADHGSDGAPGLVDGVAEARRFLAARRNSFPRLDDAGERLAQAIAEQGGLREYVKARHDYGVRYLPAEIMMGSARRLDRHRRAVLIDETLDGASRAFQLATQIVHLELRSDLEAVLKDGSFASESGERLAHRALASYGAAAILMPYDAFARAADARHYDIEALCRQFGTSFEQTAHRLTTLQRAGQERVPFFFVRVDLAGNVSKRLDGAGFPFARHGGGCPLWSVHHVFQTPGRIVTQWLELPDGQRFFSIARTVHAGGGAHGIPRVERAVALGCTAEHASKLIYAREQQSPPTPIGVTCSLCHRAQCHARSSPPIGRRLLSDEYRRATVPFGLEDD